MALVTRQPVTSASGILSLLEENEDSLRLAALNALNEIIDQHWAQTADYLKDIEQLHEDENFPGRELAALVASKVYYHLEEYEEALEFALGAGHLFDLHARTEYVEKILQVAIDDYISKRRANFERKKDPIGIDPRLEDIVQRMMDRCMEDQAYKQGLGMAIDCLRLDMVKAFITAGDDLSGMLAYCQNTVLSLINFKAFREMLLKVLITIYGSASDVNYAALCQCHFIMNDPDSVAKILMDLLMGRVESKSGRLIAYQIGFDIVDNENQHFCNHLLNSPLLVLKSAVEPPEDVQGDGAGNEAEIETMAGEVLTTIDRDNLMQLRKVLSGRVSIDLNLEFLYRNNRTDLLLLEIVKNSVDQKNSITHHATVIAHGLMQCGTTSDVFLRKNLEWLAKANNWAKFSATASLGVIHKGHIKESKSILSTYLPQAGGNRGGPYSEGGALYAMGLIHANHYDVETKDYIVEQLHNAQATEVLQHGACLGIGLVAMATADENIYEELKQTLYTDTAVAGEAAAYGIGLVMVGSANEKVIGELLAYAHDTQHDKIIRACALALALTMFRREEEAETLIQQMLLDKDAILRYGACFCIALAYCGTSQNSAIRRLLHISVSDVSDDVRRAAVMSLGFVLCNVPEQVPGVVKLLSESYNPHVRYGAAMAVGIACAGSGQLEAHNILQPLMSDASNFVRQGALIAMGLLYMQTSPGKTERVKMFREKLQKVTGDKHEDIMARFGAILACGVMDAGGRNCCTSLRSKSGLLRRGAAIGFCLFTQMWYWFPLIHMFSLTLTPTALIGLTERLKIPKNFSLKSGIRPSLFAYPEPLQPPVKEERAKVATAVLSTAAKAKAVREKREKESETKPNSAGRDIEMEEGVTARAMGVGDTDVASMAGTGISVAATPGTTVVGSAATDSISGGSEINSDMLAENDEQTAQTVKEATMPAASGKAASSITPLAAPAGDKKTKGEEKAAEKAEPSEEILQNPCRVLKAQMQYISFPAEIDSQPVRYMPVLKNRKAGFLMLQDNRPDEPEDLFVENEIGREDPDEKEPEPPQAFDWTDDR